MPNIVNDLESNKMTATIPSHARSESGGRYSPPDRVGRNARSSSRQMMFESTANGDVRVMVDDSTAGSSSATAVPPAIQKSAFQKRHTRNLSAHFFEGARISSEGSDGDGEGDNMDARPVSATFTYDAPSIHTNMANTYNAPPRRHHEPQPHYHPPAGENHKFYISPTSFHYKSGAMSGNHPPAHPVAVGGSRDYPSMQQQQTVDQTVAGAGAAGHKHRRGFSGGVSNPVHMHRRINSLGGSASVERPKTTTTTTQPQSQYYEGSSSSEPYQKTREIPRRRNGHHRVTSAGLDMLSAAAGVSKEDLAAAAGSTTSRPESSDLFASMIPPPSSQPISTPPHDAAVEQHAPQDGHRGTSYHSTYNNHHNTNDPSSSQEYNHQDYYHQGHPYPPQQQHPQQQQQYYPHPPYHNHSHNNHHHPQQQHALSPRAYPFYPQHPPGVQTTPRPVMLAQQHPQQHHHHQQPPASPVRYDDPQEPKIETDELLFANKNGHIPPPTPPRPHHRYVPSCSSIGTLVYDPKMDPSPAKNFLLGGGLDNVVVDVVGEDRRNTSRSDAFSTTNNTDTNHYLSQYRNRNARFGGDRVFQSSSSNESSPRDGSEVYKNRTIIGEGGLLSTVPEKVSSESHNKNQHSNHNEQSKRLRRKCTAGNCPNRVVQGGLCIAHGARRKTCSVVGCDKNVKKAGLCSSHGPARKRCEAPGCDKVSVQGGRCISHGAKKKTCCKDGCKKQAVVYGMCKRHHDQAVSDNEISPPTKTVRHPTCITATSSNDHQSSPTLLCQSTSIDDTPEPSPIHNNQDTNNLTPNNNNNKMNPKSHRRGLSIFQDMSAVDTIIGGSRDYTDGEEASSTPPVGGNNNGNDLTSPSQNNIGPHHQRGLSIFTDESLTETIIQSGGMNF